MATPVGNRDDAIKVVLWHYAEIFEEGIEWVGQGEDRTAYRLNGVVYKVGRRASANRYDHALLEEARQAGRPWAPPSSLYEVRSEYGDEVPVIAMPYLVDDGSTPAPGTLEEMWADTGGQYYVDSDNYVVIGGQPIVIDGCTATRSWGK